VRAFGQHSIKAPFHVRHNHSPSVRIDDLALACEENNGKKGKNGEKKG